MPPVAMPTRHDHTHNGKHQPTVNQPPWLQALPTTSVGTGEKPTVPMSAIVNNSEQSTRPYRHNVRVAIPNTHG
jgi:hypothetical protein